MITIEQARKHLSDEDNKKYSDEDIQSIISDARVLADIAIDEYLAGKGT